MTSFPAAISYAVGAVKSILAGTVLPDKLVLYLTFSQFGEEGIPKELSALAEENPVFEIRNYDTDIRSYRKLVPALTDFPEAVIVTVDDDVDYHPNMLRNLLRLHEQHPDAVIAHRAKRINPDKPYRKWKKYKWYHFLMKRGGGKLPQYPDRSGRRAVSAAFAEIRHDRCRTVYETGSYRRRFLVLGCGSG